MSLPESILEHSSGSRVRLSPYGAQVLSFIPAGGNEALFVSQGSQWQEGTAIRGGIPVIFPQFSSFGPLLRHGFARNRYWRPDEALPSLDATGRAQVGFELLPDAAIRAIWPHSFQANLRVCLDADSLEVHLEVKNLGPEAFAFSAALHSYLRLGDASQASLSGLAGCIWRDHLAAPPENRQAPESSALTPAMTIDRSYFDVPGPLRLDDVATGRRFDITSTGFPDAVVWTPWIDGISKLSDMVAGEHLEMLCVEAAYLTPLCLAAGAQWSGSQRIRVS